MKLTWKSAYILIGVCFDYQLNLFLYVAMATSKNTR